MSRNRPGSVDPSEKILKCGLSQVSIQGGDSAFRGGRRGGLNIGEKLSYLKPGGLVSMSASSTRKQILLARPSPIFFSYRGERGRLKKKVRKGWLRC